MSGARLDSIRETQLWYHITQEAMVNPSLHEALERVKMLYYLSKNNGK